MKHQYFGDINDFRKYGLLRVLTNCGEKRLGILWMLTEDDKRTDGNFTRYLNESHRWRASDPDLFDALAAGIAATECRAISEPLLERVIPNVTFASDMIVDSLQPRRRVITETIARFKDRDLVFLDPDDGLEVRSKAKGSRDSNKYVYWDEVAEFYRAGPSLLIYQHYPRQERRSFTNSLVTKLKHVTGASEIHAFATPHVLFLLAPQHGQESWFRNRVESAGLSWAIHFMHSVHSST